MVNDIMIKGFKAGEIATIPLCEKMCLSIVADNDGINLKELSEKLKKKYGRDWKVQTIFTFLSRLENKGFIKFSREERYIKYSSVITKEESIMAEEYFIKNILYR